MPIDPEVDRLIRHGAELSAAGAADAQEPLERAVGLAPDDFETLVRVAGLSFDNERYERAWELLVKARDLSEPDSDLVPAMAYISGLLLVRGGRRDDAIKLLQPAFDARPEQRGYGYQLAIQLLRAGHTADARSVAARALDAGAPDDDLPRLGDQLDRIAAAEATRTGDADPEAALELARALEVFDPDRAREQLQTALDAGDERQRALAAFNLGALAAPRDPAAAQRYYEQALTGAGPQISAAAAFNLGGLLLADDPVQARGMFERASQSPDAALADLARQQLAALG